VIVVASRRPAPTADDPSGKAAVVLPADLTFHRPGDRRSSVQFHADVRAWLHAHGVDPADQAATMQVLRESRRAHAVTVRELPSLDQAQRFAEGARPDDAA